MHKTKIIQLSRAMMMVFMSKSKDGGTFSLERVVEDWMRSAIVTTGEVVACSAKVKYETNIKELYVQ